MNTFCKTIFYSFGFIVLTLLFILPSSAFSSEKSKQVVFVRYNLKDEPNSILVREFKTTMAKRGYIEGENIDYIDYVTHKPEKKSAGDVLDIVDKYESSADIFITTSWTTLYVRSKLARSKTPQLFAPALESTVMDMLSSTATEPGTNLSGVYLQFPPEKVLQLTRRILPKLKKYAFVYDSRIPADEVFKSSYEQLKESERYGITIYYLDLASGTDTVLQNMNKIGTEAFGGAVGVLRNLKDLSRIKLPIISVLLIDRDQESLIKIIKNSNIVGGIYNSFDYCGKEVAEMTADIFDGKTTIDKIVPRLAPQLSVVNLVAAKRLVHFVPRTALEAADLVIE